MPEGFRLRASGFRGFLAGWFLAAALVARTDAQAPEQLRFEVASVKPHPDTGDTRAGIEENEGLVRIGNLPLRAIIAIAYDVMPAAVNGPAWLDRRTFDIVARPPEGYTRAQMPTLLRNLLVDRFMLVARRETREGAGYALRVAPAGHRLRESAGPRTFLTGRSGLIAGNGRPVSDLVQLLSRMVGAPVVDETALKGVYDLKLEWTAQLNADGAGDSDLSIFTAVREQLGLWLDRITTSAAVVVVSSAQELPTPD